MSKRIEDPCLLFQASLCSLIRIGYFCSSFILYPYLPNSLMEKNSKTLCPHCFTLSFQVSIPLIKFRKEGKQKKTIVFLLCY